MRQFYNYLKDFLHEDFHLRFYLSIAVFIACVISVNYYIDLEDGILDKIPGFILRMASFFLFYGGLYLSVLLINLKTHKESIQLNNPRFWISLFIGLLVLAGDVAFQPYRYLTDFPSEIRFFVSKLLNNLISLVSVLIPLFLFYKIFEKTESSFYGLTNKGLIPRPYLQLFSIVIPLVIVGSFLPGFQQQYPMYISTQAHKYWGLSEWVTVAAYESAYGWSFISVELLFRGFFVIGLVKFLGRHAIVPMAIVYCSFHFGKPLGECVSSIFGGYFLGVIAYYSRNIWGGVIIHIGLAWSMEVVSALQKAF